MTPRRDHGLDAALQATLRNAVRAPFYRRRFAERWRQVRSVEDLHLLPVLDKATAIENQRRLIVGRPPAGFGVASSGTTRNSADDAPLNVLHSAAEDQAIAAAAPPYHEADDPFPGWTLVAVNVKHGLPPGPPGPGEIQVPWMHHPNSLHMLETVLSRPQPDGRRVTVMRISVGALKTFTAWCLQRGKHPTAFGLRIIGTNSFRLSRHWRALVARTFGAEVIDNYSLSEFTTPVSECPACGWHHFGWPPVIYEVLDLVSGRHLQRGAGRLLLTGMYPYVQKMPLIRYDTGDVLQIGPRCRRTRQRCVRFLGRIRRGVVVKDGRRGIFALAPVHVQDALEARPETARDQHPMMTLGHVNCPDLGLPRWTVELVTRPRRGALLRFELRFDPRIYPVQAAALAAEVRRDVLARDAPLRSLLRRRCLDLQVEALAPYSLTPPPDKA